MSKEEPFETYKTKICLKKSVDLQKINVYVDHDMAENM